jgi:protein required for attachment to host cells
MKHNAWILVSDASRAVLLRTKEKDKPGLNVVGRFEHPDSRARARDLVSDANGRKPVGPPPAVRVGPHGAWGRPGAEPDTEPKEVEAKRFAHELADVLERGLAAHEYKELMLVAPPHFLGLLKDVVSEQVSKHIHSTVDKDYTLLEVWDLEERLYPKLVA